MLAIRMQRTGRKGHAMFRVVVQQSRLTPTSGKVVARLGHYDPHAKSIQLDKEKAGYYLEHGARPSDRVTRLFKAEGVKLPAWVRLPADKERAIRNPEKRRSTRPSEPDAPASPTTTTTTESDTDQPAPAEPQTASESPTETEIAVEALPNDADDSPSTAPAPAPDKPPADTKPSVPEDDAASAVSTDADQDQAADEASDKPSANA